MQARANPRRRRKRRSSWKEVDSLAVLDHTISCCTAFHNAACISYRFHSRPTISDATIMFNDSEWCSIRLQLQAGQLSIAFRMPPPFLSDIA